MDGYWAEYSAPQQIESAELSGEEDYFDKDKSYAQQKASRFGIVQIHILTISPLYMQQAGRYNKEASDVMSEASSEK